MKELSIEQKAKLYDKALEKARQLCAYPTSKPFISDLQDLFPELKENEESNDEEIRKVLLELISTYLRGNENGKIHGIYAKDILAWLEKQGTPAKPSEEEQNRFAKGVLTSCALSFIDYLDAHKYEGKMCVSNGECEDIENAFHNAMWDRLHRYYCKYIEKQGGQPKKLSIWKHWKNGVCGNGEGKLIYLVKVGGTYRLTSSLAFECDYIELSELDSFMLEKQGEQKYTQRDIDDAYLKGIADVKREVEKIDEQTEKMKKEIAEFIFNSKEDIKQRYEWIKCLGFDVKFSNEEKQAEQKPTFEMKTPEESLGVDSDTYNKIVDECIYGEQNLADKVEPKFKVGDWVVFDNGNVEHITSVGTHGYTFDDGDYLLHDECDKIAHLWSIQDAKDGSVLAAKTTIGYPNPFIAIYKEHGLNFFNSHCFVSLDGEFHEGTTGHSISDIHPATKEQRDLLFQKMKEAGYEWDAEKKELKKNEPMPTAEGMKIISRTKCEFAEWSEEDEENIDTIRKALVRYISYDGITQGEEVRLDNWLKSRILQSTWKPSEEQIEALKTACDEHWEPDGLDPLYTLWEQLKKLREK